MFLLYYTEFSMSYLHGDSKRRKNKIESKKQLHPMTPSDCVVIIKNINKLHELNYNKLFVK